MGTLDDAVHLRRSARVAFDPDRPVAARDLAAVLEAARWAPTPHNMQNVEIVVVDDPAVLAAVGALESTVTAEFLRENAEQVSSSEAEWTRRGTGILASGFPPAWLDPSKWDYPPNDPAHTHALADTLAGCPTLLVVLYDGRLRAPASEGDRLGFIGLGCVLENMWLTATDRGLSLQVLASLGEGRTEGDLKSLLGVPEHLRVAFGCRLGHAADGPVEGLRVRRGVTEGVSLNRYGVRAEPGLG